MSAGSVQPGEAGTVVSILCKFWTEDEVWNAIAEELPIAVFGHTFEEARVNLEEAIRAHFLSLREAGQIEETFERLRDRDRDYLSIDEISPDSPLVKLLVAMKNQEVVALHR